MCALCQKSSLFFLFFSILLFFGCTDQGAISKTSNNKSPEKLNIVATLFPQYDFAKQILKEKGKITLLLPPGTEAHSFDPSPGDISKICSGDIFIYTGKYMEPWTNKIISSISSSKTEVLDASKGIKIKKNHCCCTHKNNDGCKKCAQEKDPHIWLDPNHAIKMVDNILESVCKKSPENKSFFEKNANELKEKLKSLDKDFEDLISNSSNKKIIFVGGFSHSYFIDRYKLEYETTFDGCSTENEPSVKKVSEIIDYIRKHKINFLYFKEAFPSKIAISISEQTGAKLLRFSACHNVTKDEQDKGITYMDIMGQNLENLKKGLKQ